MAAFDWQREVVRRTLEGAGDYPGVQLEFLLRRLEAEGRRRKGGAEIITLEK